MKLVHIVIFIIKKFVMMHGHMDIKLVRYKDYISQTHLIYFSC